MNLALKLYKMYEKYTENANMIHTYHLLARNDCFGAIRFEMNEFINCIFQIIYYFISDCRMIYNILKILYVFDLKRN